MDTEGYREAFNTNGRAENPKIGTPENIADIAFRSSPTSKSTTKISRMTGSLSRRCLVLGPRALADVVKDLTKYGLFYWFVMNGKRLSCASRGHSGGNGKHTLGRQN